MDDQIVGCVRLTFGMMVFGQCWMKVAIQLFVVLAAVGYDVV